MAYVWRATKLRNTDIWIGGTLFNVGEDGVLEPQPSAEIMDSISPHPSFTKERVASPDPEPAKKQAKSTPKPKKVNAKAKPTKKSKPKAAKKEE